MPLICPTILAATPEDYAAQIEKIVAFAHRLQIDLTDGKFAKNRTISLDQVWWPAGMKADVHLMFKNPEPAVKAMLPHKPNMIIVHAEADGQFEPIAKLCHGRGVKVGIALLASSRAEMILPALPLTDHVLIFSGDLGHFGGRANLDLLRKIDVLKQHKPHLEIGWDGGINEQNVAQLINGGVDVLNVGGAIQKASDPGKAFYRLKRIADETGTT